MGPVVLEAVRALVTNVTELFGKGDGVRSKCPRCKGSGLLMGQSLWEWGQPSSSNAPCWFCDGLGIMSTGGLDGYMLGRSSAIIKTRDRRKRSGIPPNLQLYTGKYPESKCKLSFCKSSESTSEMLYDPLSCPAWLLHVKREAMLSRFSSQEGGKLLDFEELPAWTFLNPENSGSEFQHRFYARTSAPFSNSKAAAHLSHSHKTSSTRGAKPSTAVSSEIKLKGRKKELVDNSFATHALSGLLEEQTQRISSLGDSFPSDHQDASGSSIPSRSSRSRVRVPHTMQVMQSTYLDISSGVLNRFENQDDSGAGNHRLSSNRHRSPRRPRNRVREEAGKDAEVRAQRVQQPPPQKLDILSDPLVERLLHDDNTEDEYQDLVGLGLKSNKSHRPWLASSSRKGLTADLSFMNKLLYKKAKDNLIRNPCRMNSTLAAPPPRRRLKLPHDHRNRYEAGVESHVIIL